MIQYHHKIIITNNRKSILVQSCKTAYHYVQYVEKEFKKIDLDRFLEIKYLFVFIRISIVFHRILN